jgi:hypothetical protein
MAKADLETAIIKSLDRDPLTVTELDALREVDTHVLMNEHGLFLDEANGVLKWCQEENMRWNAQSLYVHEPDYKRWVRPEGSYFPALHEGKKSVKLSRRRLRQIIKEEMELAGGMGNVPVPDPDLYDLGLDDGSAEEMPDPGWKNNASYMKGYEDGQMERDGGPA